MKMKLAICTTDQNYALRFINYFNTHYGDRTELSEFTSLQLLEEGIQQLKPDICLIGDEFVDEIGSVIRKNSQIIIFIEEQDTDTKEFKSIYKYQKAELTYKEILNVYADKKNGFKAFRKKDANIASSYVFVSPSGGAGATTVALAYATKEAKEKKVLYLNLQKYSNADLILKGEGNGKFDDVIFALKSKRGSLSLKLESLVHSSKDNVKFFVSCDNPLDLAELTAEEVKRLLVELTTCGLYDQVIVDIDNNLGEIEIAVMEAADYIVLVEGGEESNQLKHKKYMVALETMESKKNIDVTEKMFLFYNRFSNKNSNAIDNKLPVVGGIPRFEGVQMPAIVGRMAIMDCFDKLRNLENQEV